MLSSTHSLPNVSIVTLQQKGRNILPCIIILSMDFPSVKPNGVLTRTKVENDRLGRLLNSTPTTKIRSSQFSVSVTISKRPFHELEFLVGGGGWVGV